MFGISPLGWIHTLGSLPAIPVAAYMFARFGRIVPRSTAGAVYFFSMLIGAVTVVLIAHEPVSYVIAAVTLLLLTVPLLFLARDRSSKHLPHGKIRIGTIFASFIVALRDRDMPFPHLNSDRSADMVPRQRGSSRRCMEAVRNRWCTKCESSAKFFATAPPTRARSLPASRDP